MTRLPCDGGIGHRYRRRETDQPAVVVEVEKQGTRSMVSAMCYPGACAVDVCEFDAALAVTSTGIHRDRLRDDADSSTCVAN